MALKERSDLAKPKLVSKTHSKVSPLDDAIKRGENAKQKLLAQRGKALTGNDVCRILSCSLLELDAMRQNNQVLGVLVNGEFVYPVWQFVDGKVLTGLDKVLEALKDDGTWTQMIFLLTGDIRLEGATPLERLEAGDVDKVLWAADCYGSHIAA